MQTNQIANLCNYGICYELIVDYLRLYMYIYVKLYLYVFVQICCTYYMELVTGECHSALAKSLHATYLISFSSDWKRWLP